MLEASIEALIQEAHDNEDRCNAECTYDVWDGDVLYAMSAIAYIEVDYDRRKAFGYVWHSTITAYVDDEEVSININNEEYRSMMRASLDDYLAQIEQELTYDIN